jgi:hypothetical protein
MYCYTGLFNLYILFVNIKEKYYVIFMRLETHSDVRNVLMDFLLYEIWNKTNIKEKYYGIFMRLETHSEYLFCSKS